MVDKRVINVAMLSFGFMLVFVSFQTISNILIILIESLREDEKVKFTGDAHIAMAIVYVSLAVSNFIAPSVISVLGTRISMVLGSITFALFIISFFIPHIAVFYAASLILGIGAAIIWTGQGTYLTLNSDANTIARNSALFWAAFQCSTLLGNMFVHFEFQNQRRIDGDTRTHIYSVLSAICVVGVLLLMFLRPAVTATGERISDISNAPTQAFKRAFSMLATKNMLLLCISFWFTGALLSFATTVYAACIEHTARIAQHPISLVGLAGILFGCGEVVGGALFGILGEKTTFSWGRNPIVILGCIVLLTSFALIHMNLPNSATFGTTDDVSYYDPPKSWLAIACSFLLGFGDSCFNTQIYSIVATLYREDSAPPFAIFKFVQSTASGIAYLYAIYIPLHILVIALAVMVVLSTITFFFVERFVRIPDFEDDLADMPTPRRQ